MPRRIGATLSTTTGCSVQLVPNATLAVMNSSSLGLLPISAGASIPRSPKTPQAASPRRFREEAGAFPVGSLPFPGRGWVSRREPPPSWRGDLPGTVFFAICTLATVAGGAVHAGRLVSHWPVLWDFVRSLFG